MQDQKYDVVIIGARVAGAVLAAKLGAAGMRVLLVDRSAFPSPTLSTHFFRSKRALRVFKELDVLQELLETSAPPLCHHYYFMNGAESAEIGPAEDVGGIAYDLSVRRVTLDDVLVRRAQRSPSVTLLQKTVARELLWEDGRVVGVTVDGPQGEGRVRAGLVVGADGRNSSVARQVDAPYEVYDDGCRALYYVYVVGWTNPIGGAPDGAEFAQVGDQISYVFPSDQGYTCLASSVNLETFAWLKKSPTERFWEVFASHKPFANRVAGLQRAGVELFGAGPTPNYMRQPYGPGWALVGDAGHHQDPWSGHGIDNASDHAAFLASRLVDWHSGKMSEEDALRAYHQYRDETGKPVYEYTVHLSRDLKKMHE
jgi:menaquinone-9 beta-reductase